MFKFYRKNKSLGFTLIEILVVISVIGFLATAALMMINNARVKARNLKRNGDIVQLIKAFQLVADNAGGVLPESWAACVSTSCSGGTYYDDPVIYEFIEPYIKTPTDQADTVRPYQGYTYFNPTDFGKGSGAYLVWSLEPVPVLNTTCGPGYRIFWYGDLACTVKID